MELVRVNYARNVTISGVDKTLSIYCENRTNNLLILGAGPTDEIN